jgi:ORF6N domain
MAKKQRKSSTTITSAEIERAIHVVRGQRVMLDSDLAELYGVTTGRLNESGHAKQGTLP